MSIFTTSGFTSGGGGLPIGMLRLTECSWIGSVMISMTSSTSITSISGVVLMSIITSGSPDAARSPRSLPCRVLCLRARRVSRRARGGSVMKPTLAMPARWHA